MIDDFLATIAPHYCCWCGKTGSLLCDNCKYDIESEPFESCIICGNVALSIRGICNSCNSSYTRAWCAGERKDSLQRLIGLYKFERSYAGYKPLVDLLDHALPSLPAGTIIVPVPTVSSHIRERGYDHMLLIAKHLAKRRQLRLFTGLQRRTATKQREAGRALRRRQAKEAFISSPVPDAKPIHLLIDDVVTTGATLEFAARALLAAGAREVWVASISRQPLD